MAIDRVEINRALSKAIAFKNCGKQHEAEEWATKLITLLECADILASKKLNDAIEDSTDTEDTIRKYSNGYAILETPPVPTWEGASVSDDMNRNY